MKSLIEYIQEHRIIETNDVKEEIRDNDEINEGCKPLTFNFADMDNADDVIKSLGEINNVVVNDKEVEVSCDATIDELKKVYEIVKKYSDKERNGQHRSSDEQYAQKTVKFENKVKELDKKINDIENPEQKKDEKCDDKSCEKKEEE